METRFFCVNEWIKGVATSFPSIYCTHVVSEAKFDVESSIV